MKFIALLLAALATTAQPALANLSTNQVFNEARHSIFNIQAIVGVVPSTGTAFAVRSVSNVTTANGITNVSTVTYALTASHVLHPGVSVAPSDASCTGVSYTNETAAANVEVVVSTPNGRNDTELASVFADNYCSDLAVVSFSGSYPTLCLWGPSAYMPMDPHNGADVVLVGFLGDFQSAAATPVGTTIASSVGPGIFRVANTVANGFSGSPVIETANGLVVGLIQRGDVNGNPFTLARDPLALENFLLQRLPVRWIYTPGTTSLSDCRGY
jgi:hypothetical protein